MEAFLILVFEVHRMAEGDPADEPIKDVARVSLAVGLALVEEFVQVAATNILLVPHTVLVDLAGIVCEIGALPHQSFTQGAFSTSLRTSLLSRRCGQEQQRHEL